MDKINFFKLFEALKFKDSKESLKDHPLVKNATFGIEIEFIAVSLPINQIDDKFIANILHRTQFQKDFLKNKKYENPSYQYNKEDFEKYVKMNKRSAFNSMLDKVSSGGFDCYNNKYNNDREFKSYSQIMFDYWGEEIKRTIFSGVNCEVSLTNNNNNLWNIGLDGLDSDYQLPVIEIRSPILTFNEETIEFLESLLSNLSKLLKKEETLMTTGSTGIHIHIGNKKTSDIFSRLASASFTDEDYIWDISSNHDRNFQRYASMNNPQNYENPNFRGLHFSLVHVLKELIRHHSKGNSNHIEIEEKELSKYLFNQITRNSGVNITTEHPTVEYRYLSSMLLIENPHKIIEFIDYFVNHTAQMAKKNKLVFKSNSDKIVLTRQSNNMIRIDHEEEGKSYKKIKSYSYPVE